MISNPCAWFSGGGSVENIKSYTYGSEDMLPGKYLWHYSPNLNGISKSMEMNIIWFADTVEQAIQRLKEMCEFRINCAIEQEKYYTGVEHIHKEEFSGTLEYGVSIMRNILELINNRKIIIVMAPANQFYEVGWASNDTLH